MLGAISGLICEAKRAVSSAKVAVIMFAHTGMSDVNNKYRNGPRTLHCGRMYVVDVIEWQLEVSAL